MVQILIVSNACFNKCASSAMVSCVISIWSLVVFSSLFVVSLPLVVLSMYDMVPVSSHACTISDITLIYLDTSVVVVVVLLKYSFWFFRSLLHTHLNILITFVICTSLRADVISCCAILKSRYYISRFANIYSHHTLAHICIFKIYLNVNDPSCIVLSSF